MLDLNDVAIFVKVVERESFSAAGRELGMSASSVSKHIARLERHLGVHLLNRTTHHLFVTEAGREFFQSGTKAIAEIEAGRNAAVSLSDEAGGSLRIHATLDIGQTLIGPALAAFMRAHPAISVELDMSVEAVNLMEQRVEAAIRSKEIRDRTLGFPSVQVRALAPVRYAVVAAPIYLAQHGRPAAPEELPAHSCLVHSTQNGANRWRFKGGAGEYDVAVRGRFRSNNARAVRSAALAGLGLARLPEFAITDELRNGDLVTVFRDEVCSDRTIRAYYPRTNRMANKLRLLLDFLRQDLPERMATHRAPPVAEQLCPELAGSR